MKGWNRFVWVGVAVALALGAPDVRAVDGSIVFSGAVLEPTCAVATTSVADVATTARWPARHVCGGSQASADPAAFDLRVTTIAASGIADDRVLNYYANYARDLGHEDADLKLVMQTYL
jgi:type 1 fimbria pilin